MWELITNTTNKIVVSILNLLSVFVNNRGMKKVFKLINAVFIQNISSPHDSR